MLFFKTKEMFNSEIFDGQDDDSRFEKSMEDVASGVLDSYLDGGDNLIR